MQQNTNYNSVSFNEQQNLQATKPPPLFKKLFFHAIKASLLAIVCSIAIFPAFLGAGSDSASTYLYAWFLIVSAVFIPSNLYMRTQCSKAIGKTIANMYVVIGFLSLFLFTFAWITFGNIMPDILGNSSLFVKSNGSDTEFALAISWFILLAPWPVVYAEVWNAIGKYVYSNAT